MSTPIDMCQSRIIIKSASPKCYKIPLIKAALAKSLLRMHRGALLFFSVIIGATLHQPKTSMSLLPKNCFVTARHLMLPHLPLFLSRSFLYCPLSIMLIINNTACKKAKVVALVAVTRSQRGGTSGTGKVPEGWH